MILFWLFKVLGGSFKVQASIECILKLDGATGANIFKIVLFKQTKSITMKRKKCQLKRRLEQNCENKP